MYRLALEIRGMVAYNESMELLTVNNLQKRYGEKSAVNDVSFSVQKGTCFGLLGPNGAGKTTTMEVVEGIIKATGGTILYRGRERDPSFREESGIQFQHTSLLNFLSVRETLRCYQRLFKDPEELDTLISQCNLFPILDQKNNQLSGGQQQRLMLALALVNKPELIFLDEPSTGLDPQSRHYLWAIIEKLKSDGKTIVMTTHSMKEAEFLCDIIAIMDKGTIIAQGSPGVLISRYGKTNTITLPLSTLEHKNLDMDYTIRGNEVVIHSKDVEETLRVLMDDAINMKEMVIHSPNLEDVFLRLTGRRLRD